MKAILNGSTAGNVKVKYLGVDPQFGLIKVKQGDHPPLWIPYIILKYGGSGKLQGRPCAKLHALIKASASVGSAPYPPWENPPAPRITVPAMHPIILLHYWPALRDGTVWGEHEYVMFRLKRKNTIGVCRLSQLRDAYAEDSDGRARLEQFVLREQVRAYIGEFGLDVLHQSNIWKTTQVRILDCGEDAEALREVMGFNLEHQDITVPQMRGYCFKHFRFGWGTPTKEEEDMLLSNDVHESVSQVVDYFTEGIMPDGGCIARPGGDRAHPPESL
jgi:hypothetical protein